MNFAEKIGAALRDNINTNLAGKTQEQQEYILQSFIGAFVGAVATTALLLQDGNQEDTDRATACCEEMAALVSHYFPKLPALRGVNVHSRKRPASGEPQTTEADGEKRSPKWMIEHITTLIERERHASAVSQPSHEVALLVLECWTGTLVGQAAVSAAMHAGEVDSGSPTVRHKIAAAATEMGEVLRRHYPNVPTGGCTIWTDTEVN